MTAWSRVGLSTHSYNSNDLKCKDLAGSHRREDESTQTLVLVSGQERSRERTWTPSLACRGLKQHGEHTHRSKEVIPKE